MEKEYVEYVILQDCSDTNMPDLFRPVGFAHVFMGGLRLMFDTDLPIKDGEVLFLDPVEPMAKAA
jgi:hypothetical protein